MTCDCCAAINFAKLNADVEIPHHSTFKELEVCASGGGCTLCELLAHDLKLKYDSDGLQPSDYNEAKIYYRVPRFELFAAKNQPAGSWHGPSHVRFWAQDPERVLRHTSVDVEFFEGRGKYKSKQTSSRPIAPYASDEMCFNLARWWTYNCLEKQGKSCPKIEPQPMPTRIIDVGPSDGSREPSLRTTGHQKGEWAALSHCWGTESWFVTDSSNLCTRKDSIPIQDMPLTFRDAVIVTRKLGYRYIWIDSLCIVQDDKEDWIAESMRMRDYYKHAIITISTDSSLGDHVGFLGQYREVSEFPMLKLRLGHEVGVRRRVVCPKFRNRDTCIASRAWTLQEFVLAPRSLLYTSKGVVWECHTIKHCESDDNVQDDWSGDQGEYRKRFFSTNKDRGLENPYARKKYSESSWRWYALVNGYFGRDLTFQKDVFPAISGLAREHARHTGNTYIAGIWKESIHQGLLWTTANAVVKTSDAYHAPSWSWASVENVPSGTGSHIYSHHIITEPDVMDRRVNLISYEVKFKDNDPFACLISGSIHLSGRCLWARHWQGKTHPFFNTHNNVRAALSGDVTAHDNGPPIKREFRENSEQLGCYFDILQEDVAPKILLENTMMLQISSWNMFPGTRLITQALLLLPVPDQPTETYRRVGIAEVPNVNGLAEEGWEMKDVLII